jgi:hypothetical protein
MGRGDSNCISIPMSIGQNPRGKKVKNSGFDRETYLSIDVAWAARQLHVAGFDRRTCLVPDENFCCLSETFWHPMIGAWASVTVGQDACFPLPECIHSHQLARCPVTAANHWHSDAICLGWDVLISPQKSEIAPLLNARLADRQLLNSLSRRINIQ